MANPESSDESGAASRPHVLIIDDELAIGRLIASVLETECTTTVVASAEAALDLLVAGVAFDAIFCDMQMPGMGGAAFLARVAARFPSARPCVVLMSGAAPPPTHTNVAWLDKPFSSEQVRARLAAVLAATATARSGLRARVDPGED